MCLITFQGSIVNETNPENSLEGLMLKLKPQYCGHLMRRADSLEKTLKLGKIEGRTRRGQQDDVVGWHHWLNGHEFEQALRDDEGQGSLACCSPWGHRELDMSEQLVVLQLHLFPAPSSLLDGELVYRTGLGCTLVHFFPTLPGAKHTYLTHRQSGSAHWRNNPAKGQTSEWKNIAS